MNVLCVLSFQIPIWSWLCSTGLLRKRKPEVDFNFNVSELNNITNLEFKHGEKTENKHLFLKKKSFFIGKSLHRPINKEKQLTDSHHK